MDDNNICTTDGCNLITGIFHNVINTDDTDVCTIDGCDTMLGVLHYTINMDDGIACTIDDCDPLTGVYHYAAPPINVSPNTNLCAGGFTTLSVFSNNDPNYVYSWSPTTFLDDPASAVPVASGVTFSIIYTVTATDIYTGCTVSATTSVIVAPLISVAATLSSQIACSNTSFTVTAHFSGGGAPYNFTWSDGVGGIYPNAQSITANLPAGTFSFDCTVSDYCGETGISSSPTVIINPAPDLTIATQSNISCNGLNDGSIDLNASNGTPPYEFYLGGLATTDGIYTGLATGNYTATTFDDNGCESAPLIVSITEPSSIIIMDSIISVTSNGANDGIILISVNGGISPYSYLWSTGATTASILSLAGGSYLLTVTDANGCSLSNSYLVSEPAPLSLGNYPNTTIVTGGNTTITPDNAPISILSAVANTNTNFTGTLTVDPITGIVTVTDAKQAGTYAITVKGFGSGGLTVTATFTLNVINGPCSNGLFTNATDATVVASQPYSVAIGDFNNDGNQDMAVSIPDNNSVSIRMGDGNGNFTGSTNLQVGNSPRWVSVGDFNGDGLEDLAIANINSNSISIRLGNGNGGFDGNTELPVGLNPYCVAIGDFNGDGKSDLATANTDANNVSIRIGDGAGNFSGNLQVPVGSLPFAVAIGDYNNDGNQDLAVANGTSNSISIRIGDGLGNFSGSGNIPTGTVTTNVQLGDFNNDGNQDLVASNQNSNNISILQGDGSGGFIVTHTLNTGIHPWSSAVGDFNGDGKQDILTANYSGNKVSEYLGDGTGGFFRGTDINISNQPFSIAVGDFNNDSIQDFAVANFGASTVSIRLGLGGTIGTEINLKGNNTGIIDGDVTPDVVDGTDFGNVNVGGNIIRTYTIENTGTTDLTLNGISMSGANAPLFLIGGLTIPSTLAPNGSTTFTVAFSPTSSGVKTATVHIANDDCNESDYDFAVRGSGGTGGSVILSQNILLEGYYLGGGMMNGCLNINGISADPMDADSIFISAMNPTSPYAEVDRQTGILKTNGDVSVSFGPSVIADNFYYLKLNHRNSVETWSGAPVQLTAITTYSFSSAASQAFASNEALTSDNLYAAIHTGDLNQDGSVDGSDFLELDPSIQNGDGGYLVGDLNGDGSVDASDFLVLDPNIQNGVGAIAP